MDSTEYLDTWQEAGKKKKQSKSTEPKENDNKEQNVSENEKKNSSEPTVEREKRENGTSRYTRGSNNPRGRNRGTYKSVKSGKDDAKTMEHDTKDVTEQHSKEKEPTSENNQNVSVHSSRGRVMRGRGNGRFFRGGPFLRRNLILRMSSKKVRKTTNLLTIKARINHLATKLKLGRNSLLNFIRKIVLLKLSPLFQHPKSTTNLETKLPLHAQSHPEEIENSSDFYSMKAF